MLYIVRVFNFSDKNITLYELSVLFFIFALGLLDADIKNERRGCKGK